MNQCSTIAGLDLGDKYRYLCLIDTKSSQVIEESRLSTSPRAFEEQFSRAHVDMHIALGQARTLRRLEPSFGKNQQAGGRIAQHSEWKRGNGAIVILGHVGRHVGLDQLCLLIEDGS